MEAMGLKSCKCRHEEEQDFQQVDDEDNDPDYQPEKDPEQLKMQRSTRRTHLKLKSTYMQ